MKGKMYVVEKDARISGDNYFLKHWKEIKAVDDEMKMDGKPDQVATVVQCWLMPNNVLRVDMTPELDNQNKEFQRFLSLNKWDGVEKAAQKFGV